MSDSPSYINYFTDYTNIRQSLFLGSKVGLIENLRNEFPVIWNLYKQLKSLDWDENEIDISSCRNEFKTLPKETCDLMIRTLAWQYEADSSAAHIGSLMLPFVNNSELTCYLIELMKNECLTEDHEVLTPDGWKRISAITVKDNVAQWNCDTKEISFVNPRRVTDRPHLGKMYHIYDDDGIINQITTGNHRLPVEHANADVLGGIRHTTTQALGLTSEWSIPTMGLAANGLQMTPQEKLYIAIGMDGGTYGFNSYSLLVDNQAKLDRVLELAKQANWKVKQVTGNTGSDDVKFLTLVPPLSWYVSDLDNFGWFKLSDISSNWATDFIKEIQHWGKNTPGSDKAEFTLTDERVKKVTAIAKLAGYHTTYSYTGMTTALSFSIIDKISCDKLHRDEVDYNGQVYCLTVSSGYFLVRHRNVVSITGNCLHSLAYKVIVENSFDNPEEFLQTLLSIEESFKRLGTVKKVFDETYKVAHEFALGVVTDEAVVRRAIFKFWVAALALERIQFMSSFAITFGLAEQGYFVPIAKLVQKIFNEEFQVHVQADKAILRNEMALESNFSAYLESLDDICAIIKEVVEGELTWTDFLFGDKDEIAGIRKKNIRNFVLYSATDVYRFLGIESPFETVTENPLPYMNKWATIDDNQASPQEESVGNYLLGGYINDMSEVDMSKYGLEF